MSLLPSRGPETSTSQEGELQVVGVDDDVAPLLDALNSETARAVLNEIYDDPGTPSEIADRLDMSIQKVSYHIDKLDEQELIAVAGTQYSEKGQEMTVYQPPEDPTVLFVGTQERKRSLRTMMKRLLPVIGILALGSLAVQRFFGTQSGVSGPISTSDESAGDGADGGDSGDDGADGSGDAEGVESGGDAGDVQDGTETATAEPETATQTEAEDGVGIAQETETSTPEPTGTPESTPTQTPEAYEESAATETPTQVADATETPVPEPETTDVAFETTARATEAAASGGLELSPGLAFFLGGLSVVMILLAWWGYNEYA